MAQFACPNSCIARGTPVKTPRGLKNIEDVSVGDEVVVVDPASLDEHVGVVTAVRSATRECARVDTLRLTPAPVVRHRHSESVPALSSLVLHAHAASCFDDGAFLLRSRNRLLPQGRRELPGRFCVRVLAEDWRVDVCALDGRRSAVGLRRARYARVLLGDRGQVSPFAPGLHSASR
ncbi:MAG: hypothetical protein DI536_33095 [Archangium gephyra]|uniref:Hedgehog/Intein (Hint) domain-containing protein n=1 Tax=Archangium gephyra TaxID=48 RepID=A0A2W5STM0_9BACT|nr:MAG: hypothetical protein DI536_33095 [Archangium gephyra]